MKIIWLDKAVRDIEETYDYIHSDNPEADENVLNTILAAVNRLSENPSLGKAGRVTGTRELAVVGTPFITVYRMKDGRLEILRILHGARQWPEKEKGK